MELMVRTKNLRKVYGENIVAVEGISLEIGKGQIYGFIGPNGAGKTTTIRMLCGLLLSTSGEAEVAGIDVTRDQRSIRKLVGYMPDHFGVYEDMRVWEYLDFFGAAYKIPRRLRKVRIEEVLDITGSTQMRDYFVDSLSRGMRQRIGIAKTLVHDPQVIFLDEPANGLDPRARIDMKNLIKKLAAMGKTLIVSSHILPELGSICDILGIIERGQYLAGGTQEEIMKKIRPNRIVELEFSGDSDPVLKTAQELAERGALHKPQLYETILQFEVTGDDVNITEILRLFIERNISVIWYREQESDLEEAFMQITDGAAAGTRTGITESPVDDH